jgi:hypothetical protein
MIHLFRSDYPLDCEQVCRLVPYPIFRMQSQVYLLISARRHWGVVTVNASPCRWREQGDRRTSRATYRYSRIRALSLSPGLGAINRESV